MGSYTVSNYTGDVTESICWWTSAPTAHGRSFQTAGGNGWGQDMAFRILGTIVPEPYSAALMLLAAAALFSRRVR